MSFCVSPPAVRYLLYAPVKLLGVDVRVEVEVYQRREDFTPDPGQRVRDPDHGHGGLPAGVPRGPLGSGPRAERSVIVPEERAAPRAGSHEGARADARARPLSAAEAAPPGAQSGSESAELPARSEAAEPLHHGDPSTTRPGKLMQVTPCFTHNALGHRDVLTFSCCVQIQIQS